MKPARAFLVPLCILSDARCWARAPSTFHRLAPTLFPTDWLLVLAPILPRLALILVNSGSHIMYPTHPCGPGRPVPDVVVTIPLLITPTRLDLSLLAPPSDHRRGAVRSLPNHCLLPLSIHTVSYLFLGPHPYHFNPILLFPIQFRIPMFYDFLCVSIFIFDSTRLHCTVV